jgi:hypothetical protein
MTQPPKSDIRELSVEQLLGDLPTAAPRTPNPIDLWIESAGVYPGTTKVPSTKLYLEYQAFMAANPDLGRTLAIRVWGKYMVTKFKKGRGKTGQFYYISRERDVTIPLSLKGGV